MTFAEVTAPHPTAASQLRQQACVSLSRTGEGAVVPGLTLRRDDDCGSIFLTLRTFSVTCSSTLQPLTTVASPKTGATQSTANVLSLTKATRSARVRVIGRLSPWQCLPAQTRQIV